MDHDVSSRLHVGNAPICGQAADCACHNDCNMSRHARWTVHTPLSALLVEVDG